MVSGATSECEAKRRVLRNILPQHGMYHHSYGADGLTTKTRPREIGWLTITSVMKYKWSMFFLENVNLP